MESFPTELGVLTCLMILAVSMWIPFIVGINGEEGDPDNFGRPVDLRTLRPWVHRAHRAHLNLLEQAMPFAVLVLIVHALDGFTVLTYWTAIAFFWLRVIHAIGMTAGFLGMPLRPIVFTLGWLCCLIMAYAVFAAA
ncbi:MAPEG family protein [Aestuariivita sp.]|jgi:uncharacterized MAPEG superfamily protein|uniref:MAPEG family protein n=1 Tax=Aestuariivita sp. TaxID=1872407 RepID=UPI002172BA41|nr:MAPEG family protein [Aestuariivita sp.]MCE8007983.1 MAPEG family protein [Aestuariivita sp.]